MYRKIYMADHLADAVASVRDGAPIAHWEGDMYPYMTRQATSSDAPRRIHLEERDVGPKDEVHRQRPC
jgi:hypothetical protein